MQWWNDILPKWMYQSREWRGWGVIRSMRGTRHAARTRAHASRPSGIASKLFGGKLPSLNAGGYLRERNLNAEPSALIAGDSILFIGEIEHLSYHCTSWSVLSCHTIDKYQMIKLRRYHDTIKRRRHNGFYQDRRLKFKMATAYLSLVQPSESTAWCRMVGAGARGALSPRDAPRPHRSPSFNLGLAMPMPGRPKPNRFRSTRQIQNYLSTQIVI